LAKLGEKEIDIPNFANGVYNVCIIADGKGSKRVID
jgi:hypothetical protein